MMSIIEPYIALVVSFLYAYKIVAVVLLLATLTFIWKKPIQFFKLCTFLCIMVVVLYMINLLGGSMFEGASNKNDATSRTIEQLE